MNITINPTSALRIALDAEDGWAPERKFALLSLAENLADRVATDGRDATILRDLFEQHWTNNGFEPFDAGQADPFVGLTEAPCITEHALVQGDDGEHRIQPGDRVWWYPDYGIRSPVDVLLDAGVVEFPLGFTAAMPIAESTS